MNKTITIMVAAGSAGIGGSFGQRTERHDHADARALQDGDQRAADQHADGDGGDA